MLIGELSRLTGISTRMLRHYDSIGLVSPKTRARNGYRDYTPDDIQLLFRVESLRTLGMPLQAIRATLADADVPPTTLVEELIASTSNRIDRERALLKRLESVRDSEATSWRDVLELVALMQELDSPDPARRQRVALSDTGAVPAGPLVDVLLSEADPNVAGALQWSLARSVDDPMPHLIKALQSPDQQAARVAIETIVKLKPEQWEPVLREALCHTDPMVRQRAAIALGRHGVREAIPELLEMVVKGADDVEAAELLGTLARQHDLSDHLASDIADRLTREPPAVRSRLTQALAEIPGRTAHSALAELASDSDRAVSITARYLLPSHRGAFDDTTRSSDLPELS